MKESKRQNDLLPDEKRRSTIEAIIEYFQNERDEEVGVIAAENILDMFLQTAGSALYNKGVADANHLLKNRFDDLAVDLENLTKK